MGDPPIRNSQFPIWAKGKGVLGPSKTVIFKKYTFIKGSLPYNGPALSESILDISVAE